MKYEEGMIVETIVPAKKRVTHRVIGQMHVPYHRYRAACGVSLRASEVKKVKADQPTCRNCQRRGGRKWRFSRSN
jgi:hypothetical protein